MIQAKPVTHDDVRARWDTNAAYWDARMGEGNEFHRLLVEPSALQLLEIQPGMRVLEIACGNGQFARKLASLGANVVATDFSPAMLERARAHSEPFNDRVTYQLADAADTSSLHALGERAFDAIVSNMALMDMAEIEPLLRAVPQLVVPGGRFVFTLMHPCFNGSGIHFTAEETDETGEIVQTYAIKVTRYLSSAPQAGLALVGQPVPQYYFHRPLHALFGACFRAGLVMDALLEPHFLADVSSPRWSSWLNYHEFPPVLAARLLVGSR